jgi:hypothetical protein
MHRGHHGSLDLIDDHLPERSLSNVCVFPNCRVICLRVQSHVRCFWYFWNCQRINKRETEKFCGDLKVVRRVPKGVLEQRCLNK